MENQATDYRREFKKGLMRGTGILSVLIFAGVAWLFADSLHVFSSGQTVSASRLNANFQKMVPIGTIVAWHKSLSGAPALPDGWVECDGAVIADSQSPFNGQAVPNLNSPRPDPTGGASGTYSRGSFLRGHTVSGIFQEDSLQGHYHSLDNDTGVWRGVGGSAAFPMGGGDGTYTLVVRNPTSNGVNGTPRIGNENRPVNMSVVWIIRIK